MADQDLRLPWGQIDHVLLDLDGTLLDKAFDDYFWEELIPQTYAAQNELSLMEAKRRLYAAYKAEEGHLNWTDLDFWSRSLELDLQALKEEIADQIRLHPDVDPFLAFLKKEGKKIYILTNAHPKTVAVKLKRTHLFDHLDGLLCAAEVGWAKEQDGFWVEAKVRIGFDPDRSLFVDDTEAVLVAARRYGIRHLVYRGRSSRQGPMKISSNFPTLERLDQLLP